MAVVLAILRWIGILLLAVLFLALFICATVLFVPVRYVVECRTTASIRVGISVTWLLRAITFRKSLSGSGFHFYLFGIRLRSRRGRRQNKKGTHSSVGLGLIDDLDGSPADKAETAADGENKVLVQADYEEYEEKKVSGKEKKSFSFDRISSIITFIRNDGNKKGLHKIRREFAALCKYLLPRQIRGSIVFGTGDPCTAGWVLGVVSMIPAVYTDGLSVSVDFEEKKLDVNTYAKGHMHLIYIIRMFVRGYMDSDMKAVAKKILGKDNENSLYS